MFPSFGMMIQEMASAARRLCALWLLVAAACAAKLPPVDPFARPLMPYARYPQGEEGRLKDAKVSVLFTWYGALVRAFDRLWLPVHVPSLRTDYAYTLAELEELLGPGPLSALVDPVLGRTLGLTPTRLSTLVFMNPPAETRSQSRDLLGEAAAASAAMVAPFTVGSGVAALADYRFFAKSRRELQAEDLPATLSQFIDLQLADIVSELPPELKSRATGWHAGVRVPVVAAGLIWAEARAPGRFIAVSPTLVRTLFLGMADHCAPIEWKYRWPLEGDYARAQGAQLLWSSSIESAQNCLDDLSLALRYPLAHELAHIIQSDTAGELAPSEPCADDFALASMFRLKARTRTLGFGIDIWTELLNQIDDPENAVYFGLSGAEAPIEVRQQQLKTLRERLERGPGPDAELPGLFERALSCRP
jgi:hypothetical protein